MAKKTLPTGFQSWIQFHDYIMEIHPEFFHGKTIHFMAYQPNGQSLVVEYSISIAALERLCWQEIQPLRINVVDKHLLMHAQEMNHNSNHPQIQEALGRVNKLLTFLTINNDGQN